MNWNNVIAFVIVVGLLMGFGAYHDATTPDNPFESDPIVVNTTYGENITEPYENITNQSIQYWNANDERYGNWTANLSYNADAEQADITVRYVSEIDSCGLNYAIFSEFTGCADLITSNHEYSHTTVEIVGDRPREAVKRTVKHEFGHIFGIEHGEEPMPLMDGEVDGTT